MTDYKPNVWYGWNGGECPVHPKSKINVVWADDRNKAVPTLHDAENIVWGAHRGHPGDIPVAFRVVKEYRQPREVWVALYGDYLGSYHKTKDDACASAADADRVVLFREVMEDEA